MQIKMKERIVKKFYDGLEEGIIYGRKCKECGAIEFPPHYACNTCGYHETEWVTLSGKAMLHSCVLPGPQTARKEYQEIGPYCFGEVELEEGARINALIFGVSRKNVAEISAKLPVPVNAFIAQRDGFKTVYFKIQE